MPCTPAPGGVEDEHRKTFAFGVMDLWQVFTRPAARLVPYTTPNAKVFLCSSSTPPGAGVHGMCGYFAARAALRTVLA